MLLRFESRHTHIQFGPDSLLHSCMYTQTYINENMSICAHQHVQCVQLFNSPFSKGLVSDMWKSQRQDLLLLH